MPSKSLQGLPGPLRAWKKSSRVLARNFESFHLSWESESNSLKLHYKRSLGAWAAQLCSGVRGDSTYHEDLAYGQTFGEWLFVSNASRLCCQYEQTLSFVCSEPCSWNTWCQDKSFPVIASIWGHGGPGHQRFNWQLLQNAKHRAFQDLQEPSRACKGFQIVLLRALQNLQWPSGPSWNFNGLPRIFQGLQVRREKFTRDNHTLPTIHPGPASQGGPGPCCFKLFYVEGRMATPKRVNFRKSSKGGGHFQSKNLWCSFGPFK